MNAYKLADYLDNNVEAMFMFEQFYIDNASVVLRQQSDRITELEKQLNLHKKAHHKAVEILQEKQSAEPVAWWCAKEYADSDMEGGHVEELEFNQPSIHDPEGLIWEKPLYTHPAKTLTDEEITQVFDGCYPNNADGDVVTLIDFARAILRKAQEK